MAKIVLGVNLLLSFYFAFTFVTQRQAVVINFWKSLSVSHEDIKCKDAKVI